MKSICFLLSLLLLFVLTSSGSSAEIEGVKFVNAYRINDTPLKLNNVALMRYKVVIKAMVSALYLPEGVSSDKLLTDVPKRLEIEYFWALKKADIVDASNKLLAANLSPGYLRSIQREVDAMHALIVDVKPGDRYAMTYLPGIGTQLAFNGKSLGIIPGANFGRAYFSIWFGPKPMDVAMRDQLLKRR